jgi:FKBP-type peptidyl-prolyl cis-trans isomerase (trigger factor)
MEKAAKNLYGQIILGSDKFIEKIREMFRGKTIGKEITERKVFEPDYPNDYQNPLAIE